MREGFDTKKQLATWDFTYSCEKCNDMNHLMKVLNEWCKKWVFQKEKGDKNGYVHWQGRVSLIKKKRYNEVMKQIPLAGIYWSPTNTEVHKGQVFNYVMKADSRVEGPWTDMDYEEPPPLTRQLKDFLNQKLRKWQEFLEKLIKQTDDRRIILIVDLIGNSGKSIFAEYLEYKGEAWEMPPFRLMEDIMQCAMCVKAQKCYLIDMPRAMKKDRLSEFYSGLEALKNGVCYEKRYHFKKRRMDRPQIVVFTNKDPCWEYMSKDRWEVYDMQSDHSLKQRKDKAATAENFGATL